METPNTPAGQPSLAPCVLRASEVAKLLGCGTSTFYRKRAALEQRGFPRRSPLLRGWHREAVQAWLAGHFGFAAAPTDPYSREASRKKLRNVSFKAKRHNGR
ncbi:hypothetical protein HBA54_21875 [Pelagibius litoralis]|uniref:Transcriptional regulator, AlpA family n=1 Tax=Pelagibius litoralis TaxID=374515 RepID=A0A967F155_9PROT|nr:hypothetical protein [Pelagibius litoralis]NIA71253.1 hypothetical protein [Pelagibius litoralis]